MPPPGSLMSNVCSLSVEKTIGRLGELGEDSDGLRIHR